jgi:N-methylhydantoinase A
VRLIAVGEVDQPADLVLEPATSLVATGNRRMWVGQQWQDAVPIYDMQDLRPGVTITGPAAVTSAFTTVILAPGETARSTSDGDVLIDLDA